MKKNLLTLVFVIAFICVGFSVVNAKNSTSPVNSVAVSKKIATANNISSKIKALEAECKARSGCGVFLIDLITLNRLYEERCAPGYSVSCSPALATQLISAGNAYEACLLVSLSRDTDRNIDRNKIEDLQGRMSK